MNPSFEQPFTGPRAASLAPWYTSTNWISVDAGEIPGWETTHPVQNNGCPAGGNIIASYNCTPIELWANSFLGVVPAQGVVLAELNAYVASKLYQNICFNTGESFTFNFAHRGRGGLDQAQFQIGSANAVIVEVSTSTGGQGTITGVTGATGTSTTAIPNGWTRYAGTYVWTGASGIQPLGFSAVSSAGGPGFGNLLDDINIQLKPYVDFALTATQSTEGRTNTAPRIRVVGVVPAGGLTLTLTVGGEATLGTDFDYSAPSGFAAVSGNATQLNLLIPSGNYSDAANNNLFTLPIATLDDAQIEDNERITFTMPANGVASAFVNANASVCGGAFSTTATHTIVDNDIDLRASKSSNASGTQTVGSTLSYTVSFANLTPAVTTRAPLDAHDAATVTIADPQPSGLTLGSWTCSATGTTCPAAAGTGSIAATAQLPVGASLVYSVQAAWQTSSVCLQTLSNVASMGNATSPAGVALAEGTSLAGSPSFVAQPNAATVTHLVAACSGLSIAKSNGSSALSAGQTTSYTLTVANNGPANASGALLQDPASDGLVCTAVACAASTGSASCASLGAITLSQLQGSGIPLSPLPANSSYAFTVACQVTATGQ